MRKLLLNLHLYGALIAGLFLIILGVTGSILAFQQELDHLLNPGLYRIAPQADILPLSAIQSVLQKAYPDKKFGRFTFPQGGHGPYIAQSLSTQVFLNSYTGAVIGSRETPTVLDNIRSLHTSLWLGKTGKNIVSTATFLSIFLIITGIYLWWPVRKTGTSRGLSFYLHYALGISFSVFLLALAVTGLVLTFGGTLGPWVFSATQSSPPKYQVPSTVIAETNPITATEALDISRTRIATDLLFDTTLTYIVIPSGPQMSYKIGLIFPGDLGILRNGWIIVDQYSGKVLAIEDSRTTSTGLKIMSGNGSLHTGAILGLPSQIVMSLASLVLVAQTVTGYLLWWNKLRRKVPSS